MTNWTKTLIIAWAVAIGIGQAKAADRDTILQVMAFTEANNSCMSALAMRDVAPYFMALEATGQNADPEVIAIKLMEANKVAAYECNAGKFPKAVVDEYVSRLDLSNYIAGAD